MRVWRRLALASLLASMPSGWTGASPALAAGSSARSTPASTELISIRATVNGLIVTVRADGTLAPSDASVGMAQQFELLDAGKGLIALRSVVNRKFVSARDLEPLRADAEQIGVAQRLRIVGGAEGRVRLKSELVKGFVCATQSGQGLMAMTKNCPHRSQLLEFEPVRTVPPSFAITAPTAGSTFTSTTVTFQWDPGGDEYWLKIGSVAGASDIYSSDSLGTAHELTVSSLPLNGQTLYVRVNRRTGTVVESADAQYTAAIRKGLAIITDFANRRLEDWTGPGFRTVDDLRVRLDEMQRYWNWLSRDRERFQWDIIRVQLPYDAVPDAYPNWVAFREAVVALALEQVRIADYDVHGDGVIDTAWLIVSSGYDPVPFAIGGASGASSACVFVDGQASGSVQAGATGNFIHETGHCLGIPDMYGTYSTLNKLTVMNDSWALPPQDFSAYDRVTLGWLHPHVIDTSTAGVWLPSANDALAAVKVPTIRANEYFLIEYRKPPSTGYGSATQGYRGLAVYHVLAGSSMGQDPPLVKLEPADRVNAPNEDFDPGDFLSPDTPEMFFPFVARSYYDDRDEIFRIDNVRDHDGGLAFDVTVVAQYPPPAASNLLINGSFETGQSGTPEGWTPGWYVPQDASFVWPESIANEGSSSASLQSIVGNDIRWWQAVETTPGEHYTLCGFLKGEAVRGVQGNVAANVSVIGGFIGSQSLSGTFDWTKTCVDFIADQARTEVACRLGFYGSTAAGKVWCDDFTLERVRLHSAFER
jgi:M6 family metalloprotease-like protein